MGILEDMERQRQMLNAQALANKAQKDYENQATQAQSGLNAAQSKPMGGLESVLAGIGEKFSDWGNTIGNIGRTVIGGVTEPFRKAETNKITADDSARRNEIAKKYGYASYSDAANDTNASQDFWNEIKNASEETKQRLTEKTQRDQNALGNVRDIDLNTAKGQSLSTIGDLLQILGPAGNIAGGAIENVGTSYKGAAGGTDADVWGGDNLGRTLGNAAIGGVTAFVSDKVGGKLASKAPGDGLLSKAIHSNVGRGTITGAAAGATGGGLSAALNGGDILSGTLQGAQSGAIGGGTMAGVMGLAGRGIDKLNNKFNQPDVSPELQTAANRAAREAVNDIVEMPTARALEDALQMPSKSMVDDVTEMYTNPQMRKVYVQDASDNGPVTVNRKARSQYRLPDRSGSTLDGILGPNNKTQLPNAIPNSNAQFRRLFDDSTSDISAAVRNGFLDAAGDDAISKNAVLKDILDRDTYNKLRAATRDYADYANSSLDGYNVASKSELPKIRTSDYIEATGYKGKDIPDYMRPFLSEENGTSLKDSSWSQIMPEYNNEGQFTGTPDDILEMYDNLANTNRNLVYTNDNLIGALETDPDLYMKATEQLLADSFPTRKIDVDKRLPQGEQIDVNNPNRGQLIQDVMPAQRRQAQPQVQAQAIQEAPAQSVAPRVRRATDMSNIQEAPNLDPADVARLEREITVNRQKQGAALLEQYGELDKPTRRAVGSAEDVLATLYNDYGLKTPDDVQYAANHVTGKNGLVSKMTRELSSSVDNVDTTIARDWLNGLIEDNGLTDTQAKTVTNQIKGALKRASVNSDGNTALDIMKQLERNSARYKGKDGTYHNSTPDDKAMGGVIDLVHDELQDRLWDAAGDPKKVLTQERLTKLKNMYKGNNAWADFVDNRLAKARDGAELRATMKPLVDGSKIVDGAKMSAGGFGNNMRRLITGGHPLQAFGQMAYDLAAGSEPAKQARAAKYARNASNAQAQLEGKAPVQQAKTGLVGKAKNIGQKAVNKAGKAAEMLNNDTFTNSALGNIATRGINRRIGQGEAQAVENRAALQDAQQQALDVTNNYNNAMAQAQQMYNQAQQMGTGSGSDMLDRISSGMERALAAGDINAYSQLADLYKQAYNVYEMQNPQASKSEAKDLSVNQAKAYTGLQQLGQLSQMAPDLGTALANSPAGGLVNLFGGNEYANQAKALATTIGYLLSGANIREQEAERIGQAYVPTVFDSDNVKQQKLSRAEQLLRSYLSDSSALQ